VTLFNSILLGVVLALAFKRKNAVDHLGHARWAAAAVAAVFPYSEIFFYFLGPGTLAQGMQGMTWSLLLMPVYAVALAGVIGMFIGKTWEDLFAPVVGGLAATWCLAALTEPGIFPLALLVDWRLGLGVLYSYDVVLGLVCVVGLGMAYAFKVYDRDLARLTLACVVGYVAMAGLWSWQAREFGYTYARVQKIAHPEVRVVPQMLSPLNWRVVVTEFNGRMHDTLITLGREGAKERGASDSPYRVREAAVWKIHRRYGAMEVPEETQRQARIAWYGWQATPFAWLGRYAVFSRLYVPQEVGIGIACVGFHDIRAQSEDEIVDGTYVVCPVGTTARVFQPSGKQDKKGNWPGMKELVSFAEVRR
jgi:inner membrane protein